jgi:hypothetical protein
VAPVQGRRRRPARPDATEFTTSAGETVKADCYFVCRGRPLASAWLRDTFLGEHVNEEGQLAVDVTDVPEPKRGHLAQRHSMVVSRNLKLLVKGGGEVKDEKLHRYKPATTVVTLGVSVLQSSGLRPYSGIVEIPTTGASLTGESSFSHLRLHLWERWSSNVEDSAFGECQSFNFRDPVLGDRVSSFLLS